MESAEFEQLVPFGWTAARDAERRRTIAPGQPARVIAEHRGAYRLHTGSKEVLGTVAGSLRESLGGDDRLAVGDWVVALLDQDRASIRARLARTNTITRKAAGKATEAQVLAANLDWVLVASALNRDFNPARLARTVTMVRDGGAVPIVLLTKADLAPDPSEAADSVKLLLPDVPVLVLSALAGTGLDALGPYLAPAATVALIGSSGVGKSTLANRLLGEDLLTVKEARTSDDRGRHTTTERHMVRLASGTLLIDTPGLREVGLWTDGGGLEATFGIDKLATGCRFRDCAHEREPGCAVQQALRDGTMDEEHYADFRKLEREQANLAKRLDVRARLEEKRKWKIRTKANRSRERERS